jgi:hypothetical protein
MSNSEGRDGRTPEQAVDVASAAAVQEIDAAIVRATRHGEQLAGRSGPPAAGDIYDTEQPSDRPISWALLRAHPDASQAFFVAPTDCVAWAGVTDVVVPASRPFGPCTIRCGHGVWVPRDALTRRVGFLSDIDLGRARDVLARLVRGTLVPAAAQLEDESEPEYNEWTAEVATAVAELDAFARSATEGRPALPDGRRPVARSRHIDYQGMAGGAQGEGLEREAEFDGGKVVLVWSRGRATVTGRFRHPGSVEIALWCGTTKAWLLIGVENDPSPRFTQPLRADDHIRIWVAGEPGGTDRIRWSDDWELVVFSSAEEVG